MMDNLTSLYEARFQTVLGPIAINLRLHLQNAMCEVERIDSVAVRPKGVISFVNKALKTDEDGNTKYNDPLVQIQDQIGARITVLYLSDVHQVKLAIEDHFHAIEWQAKEPDSEWEFGYFGEHFVLKIPDDVIPEGAEDETPEFFELQIKTLFQHAWSEASHDIGYKAPRDLTTLEKRKMAFSAAQAWGADQVFSQLACELVASNDE